MSDPTIALYYDDYARTMDARLVAIRQEGLALDRTVFYPRGGNQDCDHGRLWAAGAPEAALAVTEVVKAEDGVITHRTATVPPEWQPGLAVQGAIDWERRLTLMRLHTAQHLVSRWFLDHGDNTTLRTDIGRDGCTIDLARPVSVADALDCQDDLNRMIAAGRGVRRIDTDGYLEIEVAEFDRQPCGGTHVHDVREIGRIAFTRVKGTRLELRCGPEAEAVGRQMAQAALSLLGDLETDVAGFAGRAQAVVAEARAARPALAALREEVAEARVARALGGPRRVRLGEERLELYAIDLEMIESKQAPRLLKPAQGAGRVFLCLCAGRTLTIISGSAALPAGGLVARLKARYPVNGGGSPAVAQCGPLPADTTLDSVLDVVSSGTEPAPG
jgi:Ser-tRNA(Ala) deacylase AlaX